MCIFDLRALSALYFNLRLHNEKRLKILKGLSEAVNRGTDNAMAKLCSILKLVR